MLWTLNYGAYYTKVSKVRTPELCALKFYHALELAAEAKSRRFPTF